MDTTAPRTSTSELSGPAAIHDFLVDAYGAGLRLQGADPKNLLRHRRVDAGAFSLNTLGQADDLTFQVDPRHTVVITRVSTARLGRVCLDADGQYGQGDVFINAYPDHPHSGHLSAGEITNCVLEPGTIARVAAAAPGRRTAPIRFTGLEPTSPACSTTRRRPRRR